MKRVLFVWFVGGALILSAARAHAIDYTDVQNPNVEINTQNPVYGSYFNIINPGSESYSGVGTDAGGYVLGTPISDATATFWFQDSGADGHGELIAVGLGIFQDGHILSDGALQYQGGDHWNASVNILGSDASIDILMDQGLLNYAVTGAGDFTLQYARLVANTSDANTSGSSSVPDGGTTLVLLGAGFLGLLGFQRKFAASR